MRLKREFVTSDKDVVFYKGHRCTLNPKPKLQDGWRHDPSVPFVVRVDFTPLYSCTFTSHDDLIYYFDVEEGELE